MTRPLHRILAAFIVASSIAGAAWSDDKRPRKWWHDERFRTELGLTDQQSADIEQIFQARLPTLRAAKAELDQLESELSKLIAEGKADEAGIARLLDRVEASRSVLNKSRVLMIYRMHQVLTPEQRVKFKALHDKRPGEPSRDRRDGHLKPW